MKNVVFVLVVALGLSFASFAGADTDLAVIKRLEQIEKNQKTILTTLEEMKAELQAIKVRVTR